MSDTDLILMSYTDLIMSDSDPAMSDTDLIFSCSRLPTSSVVRLSFTGGTHQSDLSD